MRTNSDSNKEICNDLEVMDKHQRYISKKSIKIPQMHWGSDGFILYFKELGQQIAWQTHKKCLHSKLVYKYSKATLITVKKANKETDANAINV